MSRIIGYWIRRFREGHVTREQAWEEIVAYNAARIVPPWPLYRLKQEAQRVAARRRRYVLVGASELDAISPQHEWDNMEPGLAARYGTLVWNRFVTHGYGEGRGARLPYERYLQLKQNPDEIVVEVPSELARHFKYVCRAFTDDDAAILLREILTRLERGKTERVVDWQWDRQIDWINKALDSVWKDRGLFPGLGPVLEALGLRRRARMPNGFFRSRKRAYGLLTVRSAMAWLSSAWTCPAGFGRRC